MDCKEKGEEKEFRGEEMDRHTAETGHKGFYPKPASIFREKGTK